MLHMCNAIYTFRTSVLFKCHLIQLIDIHVSQTILETQEENILAEKGKEERTAATITEQMYMESMVIRFVYS